MVGRVGKWENGIVGGWKSGKIENIWFSLLCVWLKGGKVGGWKTLLFGWREKWKDGKCNLYKLTIIPVGSQIVAQTQVEKGDEPNKPSTINL